MKAAAADGTLEPGRLESFLKVQTEQAEAGRLRDERAMLDAKKASRAGSKALREIFKDRERRDR